MTEPRAWNSRVDDLLTRLSCDSLVEPVGLEHVRTQLLAVATAIGESASPEAQSCADRIRLLSLDLTAAQIGRTVEETLAGWEAIKGGDVPRDVTRAGIPPAPAPAPAAVVPDDELATLASDPEMAGMFVTPTVGGWTPLARLRVEQRWLDPWDGTSHRVRILTRAQRPLGRGTPWGTFAYDEAMFTIDRTSRAPARGFDRNRLAFGVTRRFSKVLSNDIGYIWEHTAVPSGSRNEHIFLAAVNLALPR